MFPCLTKTIPSARPSVCLSGQRARWQWRPRLRQMMMFCGFLPSLLPSLPFLDHRVPSPVRAFPPVAMRVNQFSSFSLQIPTHTDTTVVLQLLCSQHKERLCQLGVRTVEFSICYRALLSKSKCTTSSWVKKLPA